MGGELQELGAALRTRGLLPARARELAVLAVAAHHRSGFEWWAHTRIAADAGVPDELVEAVLSGTGPLPDDPVERAALVATRELLRTGDLDDGAWEAAHAVLRRRGAGRADHARRLLRAAGPPAARVPCTGSRRRTRSVGMIAA